MLKYSKSLSHEEIISSVRQRSGSIIRIFWTSLPACGTITITIAPYIPAGNSGIIGVTVLPAWECCIVSSNRLPFALLPTAYVITIVLSTPYLPAFFYPSLCSALLPAHEWLLVIKRRIRTLLPAVTSVIAFFCTEYFVHLQVEKAMMRSIGIFWFGNIIRIWTLLPTAHVITKVIFTHDLPALSHPVSRTLRPAPVWLFNNKRLWRAYLTAFTRNAL